MPTNPLLIEALNKCLDSFYETIGRLRDLPPYNRSKSNMISGPTIRGLVIHFLTVSAPSDEQWQEVRDVVSCLDSIADVMRQALDAMLPNAEERAQLLSPIDNGEVESDDSEIVP